VVVGAFFPLEMPPKTKQVTWKPTHAELLQKGFREHGWDPEETDGKRINAIIKSEKAIFEELQPFFNKTEGGTKKTNNQIYTHYKTQGSEFITAQARTGIRRTSGASCVDFVRRFVLCSVLISCHCSLLSSIPFTDLYLGNKGVAGGRKREHEEGDEDEDDGISLGSNDTESEDEEEEEDDDDMSTGKKKATPGAKAPAPAPASAPAKGTKTPKDAAMEEFLSEALKKLKLNKGNCGFDFTCTTPYYFWTYTYAGTKHIKFEFLTWGIHQDDIVPKISPDGAYLALAVKIPDSFLAIARQIGYYTGPPVGGNAAESTVSPSDSIFSEGQVFIKEIKELYNMEDIKPVTIVKLPFPVVQQFFDPYHFDGENTGYGLRSYPHEKDPNRKVFVFHCSLRDAKSPRVKTNVGYSEVNMGAADYNAF